MNDYIADKPRRITQPLRYYLTSKGQAMVEFTIAFILLIIVAWIPADFGLAFYTSQHQSRKMAAQHPGGHMSKVYESLKDVVPVTAKPFARIEGTNALTFNDEMEELEKFVAEIERQATKFHQAIQQTKEEAASEAKRVDHSTETFKAKIAALEAQLRKMEETVHGKDSTIKALEEYLTGKIQEWESQEKLLANREKQVNDLNSQVQVLTKRIKDMSSFFRHAEALAALETQDIGTVLQTGQSRNEQDKTATSQTDSPKMISNKTDMVQETVSPEFFDRVTHELTQAIGPMASVIIRDHVQAIGESMKKFPQVRLTELLKIVSEEIPDKNTKNNFLRTLSAVVAPVQQSRLF